MKPADVPGPLPECIGEHLAGLAGRVPEGRAVVEVGSYLGRSACYMASAGVHVYAVDAWDLDGNRDASKWTFTDPATRRRFDAHVAGCGLTDRVTPIHAFSVDAAADWDGPPVGLLFLDGDHSYGGVCADWVAWKPHLADGATVAFDDARRRKFGVWRLVEGLQRLGYPVEWQCDDRLAVVQT